MFDLDTCLVFITNNVAKEIAENFNERLTVLGTTRVQWIALYYIGKEGTISQSELGERMGIKASSVARLIDRMEREEYVVRKRSKDDKRRVDLYLTDKGKEVRERLLPEGEKMSQLVSKDISSEEMHIFKDVLNKMSLNLIKENE